MSNYTKNQEEKESKEVELYNFITSDNFLGLLEENQFIYDSLMDIQEKEEKDHQSLWRQKKSHLKKLKENMNFLTRQIDMITTSNLDFDKIKFRKLIRYIEENLLLL